MLPAHLTRGQHDSKKKLMLGSASMMCVTGVLSQQGSMTVTRSIGDEEYSGVISYRIFRARQLQMLPAPVVVLHGGPGVPSNYLLPLVNVITDRALIFYDQLGCGKSSRPAKADSFSIDNFVADLRKLLNHLNITYFHLLGHSFGGILAFEYLREQKDVRCLSLILSSTPTDTNVVKTESTRLRNALKCEDERNNNRFFETHECRVVPTPLILQDAFQQAGKYREMSTIPTYCACDDKKIVVHHNLPPCLILRGQHDFVTDLCVNTWSDIFPKSQHVVLTDCSHYAMLENEQLFGDVVRVFLEDNDI